MSSILPKLFEASKTFITKGVSVVIVTLGAGGAYLCAKEHVSGGEGLYFPAQKVDVVDTTAAGDTFVGAFAAIIAAHTRPGPKPFVLQRDRDVDVDVDVALDALKYGLAAAAITVQEEGAQSSIPTRAELGYMKL